MLRSLFKKKILFVTINLRQRTLFEFKTGSSTPKVYTIIPSGKQILQCVLEAMIVVFMRTGISLREFNTCKCDVGTACCHCPYEFPNPTAV
jgi:hypothetical protein